MEINPWTLFWFIILVVVVCHYVVQAYRTYKVCKLIAHLAEYTADPNVDKKLIATLLEIVKVSAGVTTTSCELNNESE